MNCDLDLNLDLGVIYNRILYDVPKITLMGGREGGREGRGAQHTKARN